MSFGALSPSDLTQILVHIYSRLRKGETTAAAAYREASSLLDALKEHPRARNGKKAPKPEVIVETAYIPPGVKSENLVRLTPEGKPWEESQGGTGITTEEIELLQVNVMARARRGEVTEAKAKKEAFILRAIRYGLSLLGGSLSPERSCTFAHQGWEYTKDCMTFISCVPGRGQEDLEPEPPWLIYYMGELRGYFVPADEVERYVSEFHENGPPNIVEY
jgi:hypothetical protein